MSEQSEIDKKEKRRQDELAWARGPIKEVEELKAKAKEEGLDEEKFLLGYFFENVIADDGNSFHHVNNMKKGFKEEEADLSKMKILERLSWEVEFRHTPEILREQIKKAKRELEENMDWKTATGYKKAYDFWRRNVKERAEVLVNTPGSTFEEAYQYFLGIYYPSRNKLAER